MEIYRHVFPGQTRNLHMADELCACFFLIFRDKPTLMRCQIKQKYNPSSLILSPSEKSLDFSLKYLVSAALYAYKVSLRRCGDTRGVGERPRLPPTPCIAGLRHSAPCTQHSDICGAKLCAARGNLCGSLPIVFLCSQLHCGKLWINCKRRLRALG